jgi:glycosyltransferase involved in cell wall biosynthesis
MKLSIIIPAYNSAKYIYECVSSLSNNSTRNFEIIVINDGSIDNTGEILDNLTIQNIKVFHTENKGLSAARNKGVHESNGEYILFLDSDDMLFPNAIDTLLFELSNQPSDVLFFESETILNDPSLKSIFEESYEKNINLTLQPWTGFDFFAESIRLNSYSSCAWMYVSNRKAARGISFFEGVLHEDNMYTARLLLENDIIVRFIKKKFIIEELGQTQ